MSKLCDCGCAHAACPECGFVTRIGTMSHCPKPSCKEMNAPMDCQRCLRVVASSLDGVLDFDMNLVPFKEDAHA